MTDPYPQSPTRRRFRRGAAATAAAALAGTVLAPGLATGPAAAAPDCDDALPYRAAATADLLRLSALDLPILGLGPLVDARVASSGAGMAGDGAPAAAAAARDLDLNLLGADLVTPLSVQQTAPPANGAGAKDSRAELDLKGLLKLGVGTVDAHATWDDELTCGTPNGAVATGSSSLVDAELLPGLNNRALVALPDNLSSWSETGLVEHDGAAAAQATAAASLADLRVFAGSSREITVKVISEPTLQVTATGAADTSVVSYDSPVLEVDVPGVGSVTVDADQPTVDIALLPSAPPADLLGLRSLVGYTLDDVFDGLDQRHLSGLTTDGQQTTTALPGLDAPEPSNAGSLPLLADVVPEPAGLNLDKLAVLRLSVGELEAAVSDDEVSAAAASVRLQLLRWGGKSGPADQADAVLDLGIGLLSANAEAPEPVQDDPDPTPPGEGGECEECPDDELPVTGSTIGMIAGAGVLLALAGRLMMLVSRGNRGKRLLIG